MSLPEFTVLGYLTLPLLLIIGLNFRWSLTAFIVSVPWRTAVLFTTIGHPFTLPEVTLLVLIGHVAIQIIRTSRDIPLPATSIITICFGIVATASLTLLIIDPPVGLYGRPYNIEQGFGEFTLVEIGFSRNSITQLILRWLFVGAIVSLTYVFSQNQELLPWAVRITVLNAIVIGVIGVLYQISILSGLTEFSGLLQQIGFNRFPAAPNSLGPLPRMYSVTGEPGATAHFLLFAASISLVDVFFRGRSIFSNHYAIVISGVLLALLILTTGTTGYGGVIILSIALLASSLLSKNLSTSKILATGVIGVLFAIFALVLLSSVFDVYTTLLSQAQKITFNSSSGSLRARYITHSLTLLIERPLLGTGVGTHQGTSFLASSLAETGMLGGGTLLLSVVYSYRTGIASSNITSEVYGVALAVAVVATVGTAFIARSMSASLFPWIWLALAWPAASIYRR